MLIYMLLAVGISQAQTGCNLSIFGQVLDEHDGSELGFANLWLVNEKRGTSADINGFYRIDELCSGEYTLVVSHVGCDPDTVVLKLKRSKEINLKLEHHTEELQEVQIEGRKEPGETVQHEELTEEQFYENSGKPIGEILKEINGVTSFKTGSNVSKPIISGFSGNRVQIMNQGVQHQSQQWGDEHAPEIDPFAATQYSVIKGAGAVKYSSGAIGGLIIAKPKLLPQNVGINGELNALYATNNRMGNGSVMLEGNAAFLPKFSWRIQGSLKRSGNIKTPNYYQKNTGVKEYNGSMHLGYFEDNWSARIDYSQFNSEIGIFTGAHIGNLTDLENAIDNGNLREVDRGGFSYDIGRPYQRIIHELAKGELNYYFEEGGKLNFKFSRQFNIREEFDKELPRNDELAALNIPEFSLSLESYSSNLNYSFSKGEAWQFETGAQYIYKRNSVNSFTDFIPDYTQALYSGYFISNLIRKNGSVELGARFEYSDMKVNKLIDRVYVPFGHQFATLSINLGYTYNLSNVSSLKANASYASRAPEINELHSDGLHHGSASLEFGDPNLTQENAFALNATYLLEQKRWTYELYAYAQYIKDFIYLEPQGLDLTIRGAFPSYQWSSTNALIRGIDQSINYSISDKWTINNKLSLLWGNNLSDNNYLINMPSQQMETNLSYTTFFKEEHRRLQFKIGHQWVGKQNRFNVNQEFATPPDGYQLFSAAASYRLHFNTKKGRQQTFELALKLDNALNTVYRDYLNRFRYFTDEQGRNLTIRINYKF